MAPSLFLSSAALPSPAETIREYVCGPIGTLLPLTYTRQMPAFGFSTRMLSTLSRVLRLRTAGLAGLAGLRTNGLAFLPFGGRSQMSRLLTRLLRGGSCHTSVARSSGVSSGTAK